MDLGQQIMSTLDSINCGFNGAAMQNNTRVLYLFYQTKTQMSPDQRNLILSSEKSLGSHASDWTTLIS